MLNLGPGNYAQLDRAQFGSILRVVSGRHHLLSTPSYAPEKPRWAQLSLLHRVPMIKTRRILLRGNRKIAPKIHHLSSSRRIIYISINVVGESCICGWEGFVGIQKQTLNKMAILLPMLLILMYPNFGQQFFYPQIRGRTLDGQRHEGTAELSGHGGQFLGSCG